MNDKFMIMGTGVLIGMTLVSLIHLEFMSSVVSFCEASVIYMLDVIFFSEKGGIRKMSEYNNCPALRTGIQGEQK